MTHRTLRTVLTIMLLIGPVACGDKDRGADEVETQALERPRTVVPAAEDSVLAAPLLAAPNPNKYLAAEIRVEQMIYDLSYVDCSGPNPDTGLFAITTQISRNDTKGPNFWVQGTQDSAVMRFFPERSTPKVEVLDPTVYSATDAVHFDGTQFYYSGSVDKDVNGVFVGQTPLAVTIDCPNG
ncbi:MAG: hypothetical protein V3V03_08610 [Hyphomonadaceae bacterium]